MSLEYRVGTVRDSEDVYEFLMNHFRITEPITTNLDSSREDLLDFFADLRDSGLQNEKHSTLCYSNNELVGICLNKVCEFESTCHKTEHIIDPYEDYAKKISNGPYTQHKANQLTVFVESVEENLEVRLGYPERVFKIDILCVREDFHRQGIARTLVEKALQAAQIAECTYAAAAATAVASQELFKKFGFSTICEVPFSCFRENSVPVYHKLPDGGRSGKLMALHLSSSQTEDDDDLK